VGSTGGWRIFQKIWSAKNLADTDAVFARYNADLSPDEAIISLTFNVIFNRFNLATYIDEIGRMARR
jgi:hypothetical protein